MNKRILSIMLVVLMCLLLFPLSAAAEAVNVNATYANGVVTIAGTGFTSGTSYSVRVVDIVNSSIKAMGQTTADGSGDISASITTGALGTLANYTVYVNKPDGTFAGSDTTIVADITTHTATIQAGTGGTITTGASGSYAAGATITLVASANSGYVFSSWTSNAGGTFVNANSASTTFTMPAASVTITANFTYSSGSGGGGSVMPTPTPEPVTTKDGNATTVSTSVKATTDSTTGTATASVEASAFNSLTDKAKEAETSGQKAVVEIKVGVAANTTAVTVEIPRDAFNKVAEETKADVKVDAGIGTVTFNTKAVESISGAVNAGNISISITKVDASTLTSEVQARVSERPVFDFSVKSGSTDISNFRGGNAKISIPYTLKPGEKENSVVVYYIDNTGNLKTVRGRYDPTTRTVNFTTSHFSQYAVGYNEVNFKDVAAKAWYNEAVGFMSARGIVNGVGSGKFAPANSVTRADFLIMVMNSYGIEIDTTITDNFADASNKYYTKYLGTAKRLGLVSGVGENKYAPEATISRQDMFAILYRALDKLGELPTGTIGKSLGSFSDAGDIAGYANDAMKLFVETGTISGDGSKLTPKATSTRAQAAQVLYNLLLK
ncbi:S-layer homology domain-containing protein [Ruminiclostridium cellulolyticum]|uniref:S-layer domain protein n=1 Tax=Ruminiclostridium cellulolyticum (strain ATCC 35319 / DSM 5812 / JCM 6584 / H10) TaxID=394503 RepID=B8I8X9_RUMCH|nr:S-layer homology domain-containing protein [Ruminiclostridium cellulolyticum]ACL77311.1 S-layer domain protein [Ruminiclostridium cellulolyticum H10]